MPVTDDVRKFFASNPLFSVLPVDEVDRLAARVQRKTLERGQRAYGEGERAHVTWVLRDGQMKITKTAFDGRPLTIEMIMPGEVFGCVGCLENGAYPCEAVASSAASVLAIPTEDFLSLLERFPKFARGVYLEMGRRAREAQKMRTLGLESVEKRVANVLLWLSGKFGNVLPFTRQAIAEMAGTTPESTIRTLILLRRKGVIKTAWKKITLAKPAELRKMTEPI
jgi:CRP-like cAMP-binding protein